MSMYQPGSDRRRARNTLTAGDILIVSPLLSHVGYLNTPAGRKLNHQSINQILPGVLAESTNLF